MKRKGGKRGKRVRPPTCWTLPSPMMTMQV